MNIAFLIKEELKSRLLGIAIIISCIVFTSSALIAANEYRSIISELDSNYQASLVDWKRIEEHNLSIIGEKIESIKFERDKIKLKNAMEVARYRIDNDIAPNSDQGTVKGFIEYTYFGEKNTIYIVTIVIMFMALAIPFDRSSLYYIDSMGYKKIFFSKIIAGITVALLIWILNFLIFYLIGLSSFKAYDGEVFHFLGGKISVMKWFSFLIKGIFLSMTYPIFSAIIPMMVSSVFSNTFVSIFISALLYIGIEPFRYGYFYPSFIAKYTFIGNMNLLQVLNGIPDLHLNTFGKSLFIDIVSFFVIITIAYFGFRRVLQSANNKERIQD